MISIKRGVKLAGSRSEMVDATNVIAWVYHELGLPLVITCGLDGRHGRGSLHYQGGARDYRTHIVPRDKLNGLRDTCAERLGAEFDVVLEKVGTPDEHLHVEFQPKK